MDQRRGFDLRESRIHLGGTAFAIRGEAVCPVSSLSRFRGNHHGTMGASKHGALDHHAGTRARMQRS